MKVCNICDKSDVEFMHRRRRCRPCHNTLKCLNRKPRNTKKVVEGAKFGQLIVLYKVRKTKHGWRWLCECSCGNVKEILQGNLGQTKSCGCYVWSASGSNNVTWVGVGELSGARWNSIKQSALKRGLKLEITINQAWDLFEKQKRRCALSGLPLMMGLGLTASIDRIDNNTGYIYDNVQWVHKEINFMKGVLPQSRFLELCDRIANNAFHNSE